jgi:aerobic C4-dicarboxylate transport protein
MTGRFYLLVLLGILVGGLLGIFAPQFAVQLKPLGDGFIALVKMLIAPVIFCTIVLGISEAGDLRKVGRVSIKAFVYFEVVSSLSLIIGLSVVNIFGPGRSFHVDPATLDAGAISAYADKAHHLSTVEFLLRIIPKTMLDAFSGNGDLLQVLLVALLFGIAMNQIGTRSGRVKEFLSGSSVILFQMMNLVMKLAPIGAGGAMAFTLGKYGVEALKPLMSLMLCFYLSCILFVIVCLGTIAHMLGFSIFRYLAYIKDEIVTVLATSSSESVLVPMMEKLERLGCSRSVVGLVIPSGYSFNLDGTNIYLTMAAMFVAQALGIELSLGEQLSLLAIAIITSKGASGVTGAGFVTLAATLIVVPKVPVVGLTLILGIDRFMSEARAITNVIGNGIATIAVSKWENELDIGKLRKELGQKA